MGYLDPPGWVSSQCASNSWEPWGCWYQCSIWLPDRVHRAHGNYCCCCCCVFCLNHFNSNSLTVPTCEQGERDGIWAWHRINKLFNWLPLAALIEKKIICMHGGIGRSINHVEQIENLQRPITMEAGSVVLMDLLWSTQFLTSVFVLPAFLIQLSVTFLSGSFYTGLIQLRMIVLKDCVPMPEAQVLLLLGWVSFFLFFFFPFFQLCVCRFFLNVCVYCKWFALRTL